MGAVPDASVTCRAGAGANPTLVLSGSATAALHARPSVTFVTFVTCRMMAANENPLGGEQVSMAHELVKAGYRATPEGKDYCNGDCGMPQTDKPDYQQAAHYAAEAWLEQARLEATHGG